MENKTKVWLDDSRISIALDDICIGSWFELKGLFHIKMVDMDDNLVKCYSLPCSSIIFLDKTVQVYLAKEIKIKPIF